MKSLQEHLNENLNEGNDWNEWNDINVSSAVKKAKKDGTDFEDSDDVNSWLDIFAEEEYIEYETPIEWMKEFHKLAKVKKPFRDWVAYMRGIEK